MWFYLMPNKDSVILKNVQFNLNVLESWYMYVIHHQTESTVQVRFPDRLKAINQDVHCETKTYA